MQNMLGLSFKEDYEVFEKLLPPDEDDPMYDITPYTYGKSYHIVHIATL